MCVDPAALPVCLDPQTLDNNLAELELRREKFGAKNWLDCGSDDGARWNAVVVSLIASCQLHGIEYMTYYLEDRTHPGLGKDAPLARPVEPCPAGSARVRGRARVGGLHHRYSWRTAA